MAKLGRINHLNLTVRDVHLSEKHFYFPVLDFLGFKNTVEWKEGKGISKWESSSQGVAIWLSQANPDTPQHDRHAPGFGHLAFCADSQQQVLDLHKHLIDEKIEVVAPPKEYAYSPGYFAVFFRDSEGMDFELAHIP